MEGGFIVHKRLKELRNHLNMNQADFAKSLGIGQSTLAMMEVGKREIGERHIKTICALYNVDEDWLKKGVGEMFKITKKSIIEELAENYKLKETEIAVIKAFVELSPESRSGVLDYVKNINKLINNNQEIEKSDKSSSDFDSIIKRDIEKTEIFINNISDQKK